MIIEPYYKVNFIYSVIFYYKYLFNNDINLKEFVFLVQNINNELKLLDLNNIDEDLLMMIYSDPSISISINNEDLNNSKIFLNTVVFIEENKIIKDRIKEVINNASIRG